MANIVEICYGTTNREIKPSSGFNDDKRLAYRIRVTFPNQRAVFPIQFARRCDAEAGLKAIKKLMTFDGTYEEVKSRIIDIGPERIRQAVCQDLGW